MATKKSPATKRRVGTKTKKTTKKAAVKKAVAKKAPAKKVSVKSKIPTKAKTKKTPSSASATKLNMSKSFAEKLAAKEAIEPNVTIPGKLEVSSEKALSVLSPYRFPLQVDNFAIQTARISGIFFVLVGAFFSLFYSQYLTSGNTIADLTARVSNLASVCDPNSTSYDPRDPSCSTVTDTSTTNIDPQSGCDLSDQICLDTYYKTTGGNIGSVSDTTVIDPEPPASITLDKSSPLTGRVQIKIKVDLATDVIIYAYDRLTQTQIRLNSAVETSPDVWEYTWDTTKQADGDYKIRAFIKNQYGGYEEFSSYYTVENSPANTSTSVSTSDTTGTVTNSTTALNPVIIDDLTLDKNEPVSGSVTLIIDVDNAEKIKLTATNRDTGKSTILGYAYYVTNNEWRYVFDTTKFPDGQYRVTAQAFDVSGNIDSKSVTFAVLNSTNTQTTTTTTTTSTQSNTNTVTTSQTDLINDSEKIDPQVNLTIRASSPISGLVDLRVDAKNVDFVELYLEPKLSATQKFLGLARKVDVDRWLYYWDTTNTPNGEYKIYAKVKNSYGVFTGSPQATIVYNETKATYTTDQQEVVKELSTIYEESDSEAYIETIIREEEEKVLDPEAGLVDPDSIELEEENEGVLITLESEVDRLLVEFRDELEDEFKRLAAALRVNDVDAVAKIKERIRKIRDQILDSKLSEQASAELLSLIDQKINTTITRIENDVEKTNMLLAERDSASASTDSDNDGISDYDEVNIFATDPFTADSDNDGFNDGAEILSGYNPNDDSPEALVQFESPKEVGIVREDILVVEDVVTVNQEPEDTDGVKEEAIISGRGLPNSYVTIYIFSTPIVVTVKTDADGSWQYRFDKELDDGEHEVYVGVTDNAGKIIAKSEPYRFVKEAQAFTPVDAATGAPISPLEENNLLSGMLIYLVLSISIVAIGLVLILLGLHLDTRKKELLAQNEISQTTASL